MEKDKAYTKVQQFIKQRGYSYSVESILKSYLEYYKEGWYVSHTLKDCIKNLENELEILIKS